MDSDAFVQTAKIVACVLCCFILSCWGGCSTNRWLAVKEKELLIGKLDDPVAQRLYALGDKLRQIEHGVGNSLYKSESDSRERVLLAILGGSTIQSAFEEEGVEQTLNPTNVTIKAITDLSKN